MFSDPYVTPKPVEEHKNHDNKVNFPWFIVLLPIIIAVVFIFFFVKGGVLFEKRINNGATFCRRTRTNFVERNEINQNEGISDSRNEIISYNEGREMEPPSSRGLEPLSLIHI